MSSDKNQDKKVNTLVVDGVKYSASVFTSDDDSENSDGNFSSSSDNSQSKPSNLNTIIKKAKKRTTLSSDDDDSDDDGSSFWLNMNDNSSSEDQNNNNKCEPKKTTLSSSDASSDNNKNSTTTANKRGKKRNRSNLTTSSIGKLFSNIPSDERNCSQQSCNGNSSGSEISSSCSSSTSKSNKNSKKKRRSKKQKTNNNRNRKLQLNGFNEFDDPEDISAKRDCEWNNEKDYEEDKDDHEKHFKPIISPFQSELEGLLQYGEELEPVDCWGCNYQDENGTGIFAQHWNRIIKIFVEGIDNTKPSILAQHMYKYFKEYTIVEVKQYSKKTSEVKISSVKQVWSPYGMINHFFNHVLDPEVITKVQIWRLNRLIKLHMTEGMVEQHDVTGRRKIVKGSESSLKSMLQMQNTLYNRKPERMQSYNKNRSLQNNGYSIINTTNKTIISTFNDTGLFREFNN